MAEGKGKNGVKYKVLSEAEFMEIFSASGGSKNNYDRLLEILKKERDKGHQCIVFSFAELAQLIGCKASSGAIRNVQRVMRENHKDLIESVKVNTKSQLIGFLLK